jgi:hypothetical protein
MVLSGDSAKAIICQAIADRSIGFTFPIHAGDVRVGRLWLGSPRIKKSGVMDPQQAHKNFDLEIEGDRNTVTSLSGRAMVQDPKGEP